MQNSNILNKKQDEFHLILSRFSHEIRNPIALIGSELQLIEDTHPEVSAYDYWNDITANLEYTKELLNNLSDYNNAYKLSPKKTELFPYLQAIISSIHPTYEYLGISLAEQISPALPALYIDRIKLKQALLNLFRNAAEAVPASDGKVKFCAFSSEKAVHISITDNGCGIPEDQHVPGIRSCSVHCGTDRRPGCGCRDGWGGGLLPDRHEGLRRQLADHLRPGRTAGCSV